MMRTREGGRDDIYKIKGGMETERGEEREKLGMEMKMTSKI